MVTLHIAIHNSAAYHTTLLIDQRGPFVPTSFTREGEERISDCNGRQGVHVNSAKKTVRIAGALYLLSSAAAGVPLLYIRQQLDRAWERGRGRPITSRPRACIVSELIGATLFIFMVRALCRLLNAVNQTMRPSWWPWSCSPFPSPSSMC
jgi:hypothetical protein